MNKYVCTICGFIYDEAIGIPSAGITPGTKWSDLPDDWSCPLCGATKGEFILQESEKKSVENKASIKMHDDDLRKLTIGELSALSSNLARGCEKQYLSEEAKLFIEISDYFKQRTPELDQPSTDKLLSLITNDLNEGFENANTVAKENSDRGSQRVLVWSEKVTRMVNSILNRYKKEGDAFLENTNIYVCEMCGFIYIGDAPPKLCPVCKVPDWKFQKIERR